HWSEKTHARAPPLLAVRRFLGQGGPTGKAETGNCRVLLAACTATEHLRHPGSDPVSSQRIRDLGLAGAMTKSLLGSGARRRPRLRGQAPDERPPVARCRRRP